MDALLNILRELGGFAIIVGATAWLLRRAIDSFLGGKLESYKRELDRVSAEHQSKLDQLTTEHRVKYQSLHSERGVVVKTTYQNLTALDRAVSSILRPFQITGEARPTDKMDKLIATYNKHLDYFLPNRIYFPKKIVTDIDEVNTAMRDIVYDLQTYPVDSDEIHPSDTQSRKERREFWESARKKYETKFPPLVAELEKEFRNLLGITDGA